MQLVIGKKAENKLRKI